MIRFRRVQSEYCLFLPFLNQHSVPSAAWPLSSIVQMLFGKRRCCNSCRYSLVKMVGTCLFSHLMWMLAWKGVVPEYCRNLVRNWNYYFVKNSFFLEELRKDQVFDNPGTERKERADGNPSPSCPNASVLIFRKRKRIDCIKPRLFS